MTEICYLLGIMPRSGTNFLENQLILHPECISPGPVWEDFFISSLPRLDRYLRYFDRRWDQVWFENSNENYKDKLAKHLGEGFNELLISQLPSKKKVKYLVTKTPTSKGIGYFRTYFPNEKLIIIIRDGRSLVESGMKSFFWNFEKAVFDWKKNAKEIRRHLEGNNKKSLLVSFENLSNSPSDEMHKVLNYLELDLDKIELELQVNLPVSGSSELKGDKGEIHWKGIKKDLNFNPTERHNKWSRFKKKVFWYIAGAEMEFFGYEKNCTLNILDHVWIPIYLLTWLVRAPISTIYHALRNKVFNLSTN